MEEGRLKIKVTAPPDGGRANEKVVEMLSKVLRIPKSSIVIVRGSTSRIKLLELKDVDPRDIEEKLRVKITVEP